MAGLLQDLKTSLDPTKGETIAQKVGPIVVLILWLTMTLALFFDLGVPEGDGPTAIYGAISAAAGVYVQRQAG